MTEYQQPTDVLRNHVQLDGCRVVDVGSGSGGLVRWLREQGADPVGIECGKDVLEQARARDQDHAAAYLDGVGQSLPVEDASADVVILFRSLHHIPANEMLPAMKEAHRVLELGGVLFVLEPTYDEKGHELQRLIDDETVVRAQAQAVLLEVPDLGFELVSSGDFIQEFVYRDFAQWEKHMVDVDTERRALLEQNRDRADELFHAIGREHQDGYSFDFPAIFKVFRKI